MRKILLLTILTNLTLAGDIEIIPPIATTISPYMTTAEFEDITEDNETKRFNKEQAEIYADGVMTDEELAESSRYFQASYEGCLFYYKYETKYFDEKEGIESACQRDLAKAYQFAEYHNITEQQRVEAQANREFRIEVKKILKDKVLTEEEYENSSSFFKENF